MVNDFIHNVRQLVRNGFPKGLPVTDLELKYATYFPGAPIPDPRSITPGFSDWTDVFRNSTKFKKWFRINGTRVIRVLKKTEPSLSVYLHNTNYLNCALTKRRLQFDPEFVGSLSASDSDGSVSDDMVKRIQQELMAGPLNCCGTAEDYPSSLKADESETKPLIKELNQQLQIVSVQNIQESCEKSTNTEPIRFQHQSTSTDVNQAECCRKRWRRLKPVLSSDSDVGQGKPNPRPSERKRARRVKVGDVKKCQVMRQRDVTRACASSTPIPISPKVAEKHGTAVLETISVDTSRCVPAENKIAGTTTIVGPLSFRKKEIACQSTGLDLMEKNAVGDSANRINPLGYVRPKGPPSFKIPKKSAQQIQNPALVSQGLHDSSKNPATKINSRPGIGMQVAPKRPNAATATNLRHSQELPNQNVPPLKSNVNLPQPPENTAKLPTAKIQPQKRDLEKLPPRPLATLAALHEKQLPDSQVERLLVYPDKMLAAQPLCTLPVSCVPPINQQQIQQRVPQGDEPCKQLAATHLIPQQNIRNDGNVNDEELKSIPLLPTEAEDGHNKFQDPKSGPPVKPVDWQKRCAELCFEVVRLVNSADLAWCRRKFEKYQGHLSANLEAEMAFTHLQPPDFVKRMTSVLAFWDTLPPIIPKTKGYDEFQEIKRLLRIELPQLIKEFEDDQDQCDA